MHVPVSANIPVASTSTIGPTTQLLPKARRVGIPVQQQPALRLSFGDAQQKVDAARPKGHTWASSEAQQVAEFLDALHLLPKTGKRSHWPWEKEETLSTKARQSLAAETILNQEPLTNAHEFAYGLLVDNRGTLGIKSASPTLRRFWQHAWAQLSPQHRQAALQALKNTPVVLHLKNMPMNEAVDDFIKETLQPHFKVDKEVRRHDGKKFEVNESMIWPFLSEVMHGETPLPANQKVLDALEKLPTFQLALPEGHEALAQALNQAAQPVRTKLSALRTAERLYNEQIDLGETLGSLTKGTAIGVGGELAVHNFLPPGGPLTSAARWATLAGTDIADNYYAEMGNLQGNLTVNQLKLNKESVYGDKPIGEILKNPLEMSGPAGSFVKAAVTGAFGGAAAGSVISILPAAVLSDPNAGVLGRTLAGMLGTVGTSLSVPLVVRNTKENLYYAASELLKSGKIRPPRGLDVDNSQQRDALAHALANEEMAVRVPTAASGLAFFSVPFYSMLTLGSEWLHHMREAGQLVYMGVSPAAENMSRMVETLRRALFGYPQAVAKAESMILQSGAAPMAAQMRESLNQQFAQEIGKKAIEWLTAGTIGKAKDV